MLLSVVRKKCDEDTAVRCLSVTFFEVPPPWNIWTSKCLQHCTLRTQVTYDSSLPFTPHTGSCANPAAGFSQLVQNPLLLCHARCTPSLSSLYYWPVSRHTFRALASRAMRHYLLALFPKTPSRFPKNLFPPKTRVLASPRLHTYQQHSSSLAHRLHLHSHLWKQLHKFRVSIPSPLLSHPSPLLMQQAQLAWSEGR